MQVMLTEKGKEYKMALLEKKRFKLISRVIRKSIKIENNLMCSFQNGITVKKELQRLNDMFIMLVEIQEELENIDDQYTEELWFEDIDQKVFSFKHTVQNWLREVEKQDKLGGSSKSSSNSSLKFSSSMSLKRSSEKEIAVAEKLKVTEVKAETSFIQKRREAELQAQALKVEQELAKAQARVKVLDKENKLDKNKSVASSGTEKGKKVQLYTLVNEICTPDPTTPPSQDIPAEDLLHQSRNKKITILSSVYGSGNGNIADLLCTLVTEQVALQVPIEPFDGNSLNFAYFLLMFKESVEKKIEDPMGRLTRLIKCTTGEAQEFVKHFINVKP